MQKQPNHDQLIALIKDQVKLPSPPPIAVRILRAVQQDDDSLRDLAAIVANDPALSAKLLKLANSPIFGRNGEVGSVQRAMTLLGTSIVKNIALSFVIADNFSQRQDNQFNFAEFWRHSICTAVAAETISRWIGQTNEDIFVTALLQDMGVLILALSQGSDYTSLLREAENSNSSLHGLERKKYGFDHQQVGYLLLTSWKLPTGITQPILYHHQPSAAFEQSGTTAVLSCADLLAQVYTGEQFASIARVLQLKLSEEFNISADQATRILDEVADRSREMSTLFDLDPGEIRPYSQLLEEANLRLSEMHLSSEQLLLEMTEAKSRAERLADELQDANTRLKELVYRDGLTGLYNHRHFHEALTQELARAKRYGLSVSLIFFDIDNFKKINDTFGHMAGDLVLMNLARAVSSALRPSDIVARSGGDEFAIILPETSAAGAKVFAARLRRCIEGIATQADEQLLYITVSIGATSCSPTSSMLSKEQMIELADRALYQSKANGRNQVTHLGDLPITQ
jgi:diguanylate cyclase (GGDEF)-like protein